MDHLHLHHIGEAGFILEGMRHSSGATPPHKARVSENPVSRDAFYLFLFLSLYSAKTDSEAGRARIPITLSGSVRLFPLFVCHSPELRR